MEECGCGYNAELVMELDKLEPNIDPRVMDDDYFDRMKEYHRRGYAVRFIPRKNVPPEVLRILNGQRD
jgi:hypothetical protein